MRMIWLMLFLVLTLGHDCGVGKFYNVQSRACLQCVAECEHCGNVKFTHQHCNGCGDTLNMDKDFRRCLNCPKGYLRCWAKQAKKTNGCMDWCSDPRYFKEDGKVFIEIEEIDYISVKQCSDCLQISADCHNFSQNFTFLNDYPSCSSNIFQIMSLQPEIIAHDVNYQDKTIIKKSFPDLKLKDSSFSNVCFFSLNIQNAQITLCKVGEQVSLYASKFTNSSFKDVIWYEDILLKDCTIISSIFTMNTFHNVSFREVWFEMVKIIDSVYDNIFFSQCTFLNSTIQWSTFSEVSFSVELSNIIIKKSIFQHVKFRKSTFINVTFELNEFSGVVFELCNFYNVYFRHQNYFDSVTFKQYYFDRVVIEDQNGISFDSRLNYGSYNRYNDMQSLSSPNDTNYVYGYMDYFGRCTGCSDRCGLCKGDRDNCIECATDYSKIGWKCVLDAHVKAEITLKIEDQQMMEAKYHTLIRSLEEQMERTRQQSTITVVQLHLVSDSQCIMRVAIEQTSNQNRSEIKKQLLTIKDMNGIVVTTVTIKSEFEYRQPFSGEQSISGWSIALIGIVSLGFLVCCLVCLSKIGLVGRIKDRLVSRTVQISESYGIFGDETISR